MSGPLSGDRRRGDPDPAELLRADLAALLTESATLRHDVGQAEVARRRATVINAVVLAVLAAFVGAMLVMGWQVNQTNRQVADCTTPGGRCYESGRARTDEAVSSILRVSIYMAECARLYPDVSGPEYDRLLEACVYQRLTAASGQTPTLPLPSPSRGGTR